MRAQIIVVVALASCATAAHAQHAVLVRQDPSPDAQTTTLGATPRERFKSVMDSVFGPGRWRQTGGYRTPEREDELRAEGAGTVWPGGISAHSLGHPGAPGAYDAVVDGLDTATAAQRLRSFGAPFRRIVAEGPHGTQGAHLHLEPASLDLSGVPSLAAHPAWKVEDVTPAQLVLARVRAAAQAGDALSQLKLGAAYAEGHVTLRDFVAAYIWTATAGANPAADPDVKRDADKVLSLLTERMTPGDLAQARRFVRPQACGSGEPEMVSLVVLIGAPAACAGPVAVAPTSPAD